MAQADYFLLIDGIKGETQDKVMALKGAIDVDSWSWGEVQPTCGEAGSGQGAGKVCGQDFNFVMRVNKAAPSLLLACANGQHFDKAELVCRKAGKN
jgi:type VI secretion system secreted protein Hcp